MPPPADGFARLLLTPRERTVLLGVGQQLTDGEIADALNVSRRTVASQVAALSAKFGVQRRADLAALAAREVAESPPGAPARADGALWRELTRLRAQLHESAAAARTLKTLDQASGILYERYRLPSLTVASRLLRQVAERHGLGVADLAAALLAVARPDGDGCWFPRRDWRRGPELTFLPERPSNLAQVLTAALDASAERADTRQGDLQLVPAGGRGLDIVVSRGFTQAFVTHFAHVEGDNTACALALSTREPVSIPDITRSEIFDPMGRDALDAERVRTVHSTPMLTDRDGCVGVLSTHRSRARQEPSQATRGELTRIATQTGTWLAWQRRTARLDALEDFHRSAGRHPATADDGPDQREASAPVPAERGDRRTGAPSTGPSTSGSSGSSNQ
ncbi:response regulator transcription factor [Amycolatopsis sp. Hca4]|uniref:response regulator transcription factor n=1 Tax=Amycolatopsis sp. Hca4 TaxID=2742131 RepID=UPI0015918C03|nr:LuxR C-terminal-related transcriptional regulator [Amycolatopsis sp. Hca4]QKV74822.1 ANTAR domain-containing protein [Amycolatopsis sp. Hca4]